MSLRISRLASKICVKNILRIFQAHFRENVKNTEPGRKFHHSYKKKRVPSSGLKNKKLQKKITMISNSFLQIVLEKQHH